MLELGYGDGLLTAALQEQGYQSELLEGSALLCSKATSLYPSLVVHHSMFESFKPQKPYSTILALHVIEHVDNPHLMLRQLRSWLEPQGQLIIVVPNRDSIHRRLALRMNLIEKLDELSARDHLVGHQRVYNFETLEKDVHLAGLKPITRFGSFLKTLPNSMMLDYTDALLSALDGISDSLPPDLLANIGLVVKPQPKP